MVNCCKVSQKVQINSHHNQAIHFKLFISEDYRIKFWFYLRWISPTSYSVSMCLWLLTRIRLIRVPPILINNVHIIQYIMYETQIRCGEIIKEQG